MNVSPSTSRGGGTSDSPVFCKHAHVDLPGYDCRYFTPGYFDLLRNIFPPTIAIPDNGLAKQPFLDGQRILLLFLTVFILGCSFFFGAYVTFRHSRPLLEDALKTCQQKAADIPAQEKACNSGAVLNLLCKLSKTIRSLSPF